MTFDIFSGSFTSQDESHLKEKTVKTVNSAVLRGFSRLIAEHEKSWKANWEKGQNLL